MSMMMVVVKDMESCFMGEQNSENVISANSIS